MAASYKSIRGALKIAAIYAFALSTAVACSKFEVAGNKIGTLKGRVSAPATPPLVAPTELTVTINRITPIPLGIDEMGQDFAVMTIEMTHGTQPVVVDVYPQIAPVFIQDSSTPKTVGTVTYSGEGVCADRQCTKFGVMINVVDSSSGADFQRLEIWDRAISTTAPQKRLTQTAYDSITTAYESLAGKLNN